ncbi:MAG: hypothetical protein FWC38_07165 [Proteobacteria bacterium]|nr:hypothetical protein [Pseudomonadota bacterium]MCL2307983.1 hypothetical protein [Pseudomonadota bacterium]
MKKAIAIMIALSVVLMLPVGCGGESGSASHNSQVKVSSNLSGMAWPDSWPSDTPKMEGSLTMVLNKDADTTAVWVKVQGERAAKAYVDSLVSRGYSKQDEIITNQHYAVSLTGRGHTIHVVYMGGEDQTAVVTVTKERS